MQKLQVAPGQPRCQVKLFLKWYKWIKSLAVCSGYMGGRHCFSSQLNGSPLISFSNPRASSWQPHYHFARKLILNVTCGLLEYDQLSVLAGPCPRHCEANRQQSHARGSLCHSSTTSPAQRPLHWAVSLFLN